MGSPTTPDGGNRDVEAIVALADTDAPIRDALTALLDSKDAEAQRLRAEVAEAQHEATSWRVTFNKHMLTCTANDRDLAALRAENAALREALERVSTLANEAYKGTELPGAFRQIVAIADAALEASPPGRTGT